MTIHHFSPEILQLFALNCIYSSEK